MSNKILILVATMGGTAELAAEEMAARIEGAGGRASLRRMERAQPSQLADIRALIISASTYGKGNVPDNGVAFFERLQVERPDLIGLRYGVFALGDSIYPETFCNGGKKFDALLSSLGAQRIGERMHHDSRNDAFADEAAGAWVEGWYGELEALEDKV
jgi:MioC protein